MLLDFLQDLKLQQALLAFDSAMNAILLLSTVVFLWIFRKDYQLIYKSKNYSENGVLVSTTLTLLINLGSFFSFGFISAAFSNLNIPTVEKAPLYYLIQSLLMALYLLMVFSSHRLLSVRFYSMAKICSCLAATTAILQCIRFIDRIIIQTDLLSFVYKFASFGINALITAVTIISLLIVSRSYRKKDIKE